MADDTEPTTPPSNTPPPAEPPDWARDLQRAIVELPGKLKAVVTDDDKSQIAHEVYGLFEQGGAFKTDTPPPEETEEVEETVTDETPPSKGGKLSGFARWFAGEG